MDFRELVKTRRSCRSFDATPIPEEQLAFILEAGQWAPSPMNALPWQFVLITAAEKKAQIRRVAEGARQAVLDNNGPGFAAKYDMAFLEEAPVVLAVVFDPSQKGLGDFFNQQHGALQAASACVQNMLLAATECGLGTLWFTWFDPEKMRAALNIPANLEIAALIPMGKPKGAIKPPPRKDPKVHHEQYAPSR